MAEAKNLFQDQIMRCSSLQRFPLYPEGIKELRDTLRNAAGSPERARQVVDEIIQGQDSCPTPAEIRTIAENIRSREEKTPDGCKICNGQPWISMQAHALDLEGSKRCNCARGQWLRQKDQENRAKRNTGAI